MAWARWKFRKITSPIGLTQGIILTSQLTRPSSLALADSGDTPPIKIKMSLKVIKVIKVIKMLLEEIKIKMSLKVIQVIKAIEMLFKEIKVIKISLKMFQTPRRIMITRLSKAPQRLPQPQLL